MGAVIFMLVYSASIWQNLKNYLNYWFLLSYISRCAITRAPCTLRRFVDSPADA